MWQTIRHPSDPRKEVSQEALWKCLLCALVLLDNVGVMLSLEGGDEPEDMTRSAVRCELKRAWALEQELPEFKSCCYHVIAINLGNLV